MTAPAADPQLVKLARTLHVSVDDLGYLADVPDTELRLFRFQVADMLFDHQSVGLRRIGRAAKVIPTPILVKLVGRHRNALLAAKMSAVLDPGHAVEVARRLPPDFLADIAAQLDARRAATIIAGLPSATVVSVAEQLAARADWITLGDLMSSISNEAARATAAALDGLALTRTAFLVDEAGQLERFVGLVPAPKLADMLHATADHDLWAEFRTTLSALSPDAVQSMRAAAAGLPAVQRDRALAEIEGCRAAE
ncbi:hypothetical protein [Nocardia lijiangensis]|uniref:hypothetical protein n=1 Tax=Nocardia lijiangensis TaxID=299618 RepID=UPI000833FCC7|nr:hypothetical protein [Nocardia lijiangensis]